MNTDLGEVGAKVTLNDKPYVEVIDGLEKKTKAAFDRIAKMAAGLFGLNVLKGFVKDSVQAFIVQENAVNGLNRALRLVGQGSYSRRLQNFAKELQAVTTYGDEATLSVMKMGLNMGVSAKQMEAATKAAMGLAAGFEGKINLETAMQLIGKAANGNTAMLARYGIKLDETKPKMEQFNELLKKGDELFQLAHAETFGQRLIQLGNAWGDLKEQIGDFFLQLTGFYDSVDDLKDQINDLTKVFAERLDYWAFYIRYITAYARNGMKAIIATVKPVFDYIHDLLGDLGQYIADMISWIGGNWSKLWNSWPDILKGVILDVLTLLNNFQNTVLDLAGNLVKALWKVFKGEGAEGFRELWDDLVADAVKTFSEIGDETAAAIYNSGATKMPEYKQTASLKKMVAEFEKLPEVYFELYKELENDILNAQGGMTNNLNRKRDQNFDNGKGIDRAAEAGKGNVAGSFSAAMLNAMIGANTPEKETAKNTKQMVEQQKETNQKLADSGLVYT